MSEINYRLTPSENSWNIEKKRVAGADAKKPGEVTWTAFKYFGTLEQAAITLREIITRENAANIDLDTLAIIDAVAESTAIVCAAVKKATGGNR